MSGHRLFIRVAVASILLVLPVAGADSGELSLADRIAAQRAIERVYYSHQLAAQRPFEQAVPDAIVERKVRDALKQSVALERFWKTPITADMLRREMDRMSRHSRMPGRLRELYATLGDDPILIQECLARPALAGRLARGFFASDQVIHAQERRAIEDLRAHLIDGSLDAREDRAGRSVARLRRQAGGEAGEAGTMREPQSGASGEPHTRPLAPEEFARWDSALPVTPGVPGSVQETDEGFWVHVPLARRQDVLEVASYFVAKQTWDEWWGRVAPGLDEVATRTVATGREEVATVSGSECALDTWDTFPALIAPDGRREFTAVWTGSLMIVWGGWDIAREYVDTGGRYDPVTDTWLPTSLVDVPQARSSHAAVWSGTHMLIWGGNNHGVLGTGGRYDPQTDTWTPIAISGAPPARGFPTAVWTGTRMLVWGGRTTVPTNTGGAYDPANNTWSEISPTNAPEARFGHSAVWTGNRMVVWGGDHFNPLINTGGRYDPVGNAWLPTSLAGAPDARADHTAVWTGTRMIVWGGRTASGVTNAGASYDPVLDQWTAMQGQNPPAARSDHSAVWTGKEMIVWGGSSLNTGGRYDPASDSWSPLSLTNAPTGRTFHTAVWTGGLMIVWGGGPSGFGSSFNTGGRYDPAFDAWTPTATNSIPTPRAVHSTIWTGSRMVIWGGTFAGGGGLNGDLNTGGRYDPATDTWEPTALSGAPAARGGHQVAWTGNQMIVWGGNSANNPVNSGGRYDPVADTWLSTSLVDAPTPRGGATAIWTGSQMVIWGGGTAAGQVNTGGRYDPATNSWLPTSTVGAPSPRVGHSAVWSGFWMIIWGGGDTTGGRYDPGNDEWTPTSLTNAPSPRRSHSAVWTGNRMVVWGGNFGLTYFNDGARYDPFNDMWSSMTAANAPIPRSFHVTLWTGSEMIVWGGELSSSTYTNTGGRYDPAGNAWTAMTTTQAPSPRYFSGGAWTDSLVLIWGGAFGSFKSSGTGYAYCGCIPRTYFQDLDADGHGDSAVTIRTCSPPAGFVLVGGDCDDANAGLWAPPAEVGGFVLTDEVTLGWMPPALGGATTVSYDVLRSSDPADFVGPAVCAVTDTSQTGALDPMLPPDGLVFYYLVRAENGCPGGQGSLGSSSDGTPRSGRTCP